MPNDVFHLPQEPQAPKAPNFQARLDADYYTPEKQPVIHQFIKSVEQKTFAARKEALSEQQKRKPIWLRWGGIALPKVSTKSLHELEYVLGGEVFGKDQGHRFGLDAEVTNAAIPGVAYWMYTKEDKKGEFSNTVHIQTTENGFYRINGATLSALPYEDRRNFIKAVAEYPKRIQTLYPTINLEDQIPDTADEFIAKIDQARVDRVEIPNKAAELVGDDDVYQRLLREAQDKAVSSKL